MVKASDIKKRGTFTVPPKWVMWAAYATFGWALLFAALSIYWALGGMAGVDTSVSPSIAQLARERVPWLIAILWIVSALKILSGLIALALVQSWGRIIPRWILLILAWGAGTLLAVHGTFFLVGGMLVEYGVIRVPPNAPWTIIHWYTFLWGPWFLAGGILLIVVAWSYLLRSTNRRVGMVFSALGILGALGVFGVFGLSLF